MIEFMLESQKSEFLKIKLIYDLIYLIKGLYYIFLFFTLKNLKLFKKYLKLFLYFVVF